MALPLEAWRDVKAVLAIRRRADKAGLARLEHRGPASALWLLFRRGEGADEVLALDPTRGHADRRAPRNSARASNAARAGPSQRAHQLQPRREIARGFFVTGGDATELLDELEEAFDSIALSVQCEVAIAFVFAIRL